MAKTVPNFGQIVMAARNRYKWVGDLRLFVKIVTPVPGVHQVNIQPPTFKPPFSTEKGGIDWQSQEGVVNLLPALQRYLGRNQPHEFYIDDDGCEIPKPQSIIDMEEKERAASEAAARFKEDIMGLEDPMDAISGVLDVAPLSKPESSVEVSDTPTAEVEESTIEDKLKSNENLEYDGGSGIQSEWPDPAAPSEASGEPDPKEDKKPGRKKKGKDAVLSEGDKKETAQE